MEMIDIKEHLESITIKFQYPIRKIENIYDALLEVTLLLEEYYQK